jgi:outer membrane protein assembly factor BamB
MMPSILTAGRAPLRVGLLIFATAFFLTGALAAEWPQYRGIKLDGSTLETIPLANWPKAGPKEVWKVPAPLGFSSFAVAGGKAYTLVARADDDGATREVCVALDAATGKELWAFTMCVMKYDGGGDSGADGNDGGDGPRSTPTINDKRVYLFDSQINLYCLEADTGKMLWQKSLQDEFDGPNIRWQSSASAVVDEGLVYVPGGGPGQSFLAFNKTDGKLAWKSGDETMTHAMPVATTIHGVRQIIFFVKSGLVSVEAKSGKELWRYPFPFKTSTAASPVVSGDLVYCSVGYGVGAGLCKVKKTADGYAAEEVWRMPNDNQNHWSTPVLKDGYLYGMFSFKEHGSGPMKCVELATGKVMWSQDGYGPGNVILLGDGKILALSDRGELAILEGTPEAYKEVVRSKVIAGKCWSTPTLSDGRIYVRSTKEGVCLEVSAPAGK